jgi:hypothetical protein
MTTISEAEFRRICEGILDDGETIVNHNPIGPRDEVLLWMLLSCLNSYLSLTEMEMPCFSGVPDAGTYRDAILFVLRDRRSSDFEVEKYLDKLTEV